MPRGSCSGVTSEWTRCGKESRGSRFCYHHTGQSRWLLADYDTLDDIGPHAKQRCCIGLIKDNSRLCNNRVAAGEFHYCHLHRAQAPPTWSLPESDSKQGVEVRDATYEELKEIFLGVVTERDKWINGGRSKSSSQKPSSSRSQGFSQEWRSDSQYKESSQKSSSYTRSTPYSPDCESYTHTHSQSSSRYGFHQSYEESYRRHREQERKAEKEKQEREEQERKAREARAEEARRAQQERPRQSERFSTAANIDNISSSTRTRTRTQTAQAAVNHYYTTLNAFNKDIRSFNLKPLVFQSFPWPVLVDHHYVKPSDVTEEAAKDFFSKRISSTTYRALRTAIINQSRKFWHPDAFVARGILLKIKDAEERKRVEEKVNMVSKIVNNIWDREFK
ncbi:hypothetical protein E1B28_004006 [Marasmius oreades]|uniref:Uncharacterized protein n=1 Tax=Marasmius oreades TaxID=181124 RepID=A0A9P7UXQ8_9AGAR|nr:uncharacterized protein E1B28_004006 [Marasmius oreades]KAG7096587.1 hypothetical protein E1B28_004006 [Marasmius oreades]